MTIIYSASPGTASNTFKKNLEIILNCKAKILKSGGGIGHILLNISTKEKILKKFKLDLFYKTKLIYGHIFPTKHNMCLLRDYYSINHTIISYRNIYDQLNYFYKWQKYDLKCPLSFPEDINFSNKDELFSNNFNIDLNLLLVLNFYKYWFHLIQNNLIENYTLFSFNEIISNDKNYQKKILSIFSNLEYKNQINFDSTVKENIYKEEKFKIHSRHNQIIEEFIASNKNVDFSLITS